MSGSGRTVHYERSPGDLLRLGRAWSGAEQIAHRPSKIALLVCGSAIVTLSLIAGLVSLGLSNEVAVPAVFLFRLATFWLPTIPGWLAFHALTKRELL